MQQVGKDNTWDHNAGKSKKKEELQDIITHNYGFQLCCAIAGNC